MTINDYLYQPSQQDSLVPLVVLDPLQKQVHQPLLLHLHLLPLPLVELVSEIDRMTSSLHPGVDQPVRTVLPASTILFSEKISVTKQRGDIQIHV